MSLRAVFAFVCCLSTVAYGQDPVTPPATSAPLPLDFATRDSDVGEMRLSPDGKYIAFTTGKDESELLVFVNLDDRKVTATIRAEAGCRIKDIHWVSASRAIYSHAKTFEGPYAGETLRAVDRDGANLSIIYRSGSVSTPRLPGPKATTATPFFVDTLPGDERHILIGHTRWERDGNRWRFDRDVHPSLKVVDVYDGSDSNRGTVPLIEPRVIVDAAGAPRIAAGYDEQRNRAALWKPTPKAGWTPMRVDGFHDDSIEPWRFTQDERGIYFSGVRSDDNFLRLYKIDLATRAVELVAELPNADVSTTHWDSSSQRIVGVSGYAAGAKIHHWIVPDSPRARDHESLSRAFAGLEIKLIDSSNDGRRSLVFVRSDRSPGEYHLYDSNTKRADMLRAVRPDIDPRLMRPSESISLNARDGTPLHGYLIRPASPGPHKMVVLIQGGPFAVGFSGRFDSYDQLFASRSYAVLKVNFRGTGGYGRNFEVAGQQKWGTAIQDDLADATRWAIEQKVADPERICTRGLGDFGGYSALMSVAREPKLYRCAMATAGVYDLAAWHEQGTMTDSERKQLARTMGTDPLTLRAQSPLHLVDRIEATILLEQIFDASERMEHTEEMYAQLKKAGKNVELYRATSAQGSLEREFLFLDSQLK